MKKLFLLITVFTLVIALPTMAQITTTKQATAAVSATFAGLKGGDITLLQLSKTDSLATTSNSFKVTGFTFSYNHNGFLASSVSSSNQMHADIKALITKVVVGDKVFFENIKAKYLPSGSISTLTSLTFMVK